ncbi:MAG: ATP synthase gamma chain [Sodalis sp.]|nr:MAG: ATP synthase gamma chain [Sodalis sp.]
MAQIEIRNKIASVQNTQKITKAMERSPLPKCVKRRNAWRPAVLITMRKVIGHLVLGNLEYKHPYLS